MSGKVKKSHCKGLGGRVAPPIITFRVPRPLCVELKTGLHTIASDGYNRGTRHWCELVPFPISFAAGIRFPRRYTFVFYRPVKFVSYRSQPLCTLQCEQIYCKLFIFISRHKPIMTFEKITYIICIEQLVFMPNGGQNEIFVFLININKKNLNRSYAKANQYVFFRI